MNHKFRIHVLLNARMQRGVFFVAFNDTTSFSILSLYNADRNFHED